MHGIVPDPPISNMRDVPLPAEAFLFNTAVEVDVEVEVAVRVLQSATSAVKTAR